MTRRVAWCPVALTVWVIGTTPAFAQLPTRSTPSVIRQVAAASQGDLKGTVLDDRGQALVGAVVSAVGATSAFAVTERDGSFVVRNLPSGPYLVRVHLQGYVAPRARVVQIAGTTQTVSVITMSARSGAETRVLEAGVGAPATPAQPDAPETPAVDRSEVAWRMRHLKRSVLKDVDPSLLGDDSSDSPAQSWAMASLRGDSPNGWLADLPFSGQVDLLTSTSFDRPQDLLSLDLATPTGVTSFQLSAPMGAGDWAVRGGLTQGDITAWLVSGAFTQRVEGAHQFETGLSYGSQRYLGGNAFLLGALTDGSRNVGEVYASDRWVLNPNVTVNYGAKYARYDYLNQRGLLSPSVGVVLTPADKSVRLNASVSRREIAPGAEEFLAPATGLWLPPQRTFSAIGGPDGYGRERVDTLEVRGEKQFGNDLVLAVRAFKQQVDGQVVAMFGLAQAQSPVASIGHYYVATAGDFDARGWGVSLSRTVIDGIRASVDYTQTDADWVRPGADPGRLSTLAPSALRTDAERTYDLRAALESQIPQTLTRVLMVYKLNSGFASPELSGTTKTGLRYDVQVNQGLPFLNFAASQWEALVSVRNMFREGLTDVSAYDELLVVRPPTRIVGGLSVRF